MGKRKEKIKETNPHNTVRARANSIHILKNNENRTMKIRFIKKEIQEWQAGIKVTD